MKQSLNQELSLFFDIDLVLNIIPNILEKLITKTKAIIVVHMLGTPLNG